MLRIPLETAPAIRAPPNPMTSHEFSFPVNELDAGGRRFLMPIRPAWLRQALEETHVGTPERDGTLEVRLSRSGTDVVVRGTLSAHLLVPCSRCLEPSAIAVHEELSLLAVPKAQSSAGQQAKAKENNRIRAKDSDESEDAELQSGDADVISYEGDNVVLDNVVRDELLLGIPMIPLCSEGCPGIRRERPPFEDDASIDPRLRPLLKFKNLT